VLLTAVSASCGRADAAATRTVGALYPTSGPLRASGIDELRGVRLAVEYVNSQRPGGKPVRLVTRDTPTPESAAGALRGLLKQHVDVVFGSQSSAVSAAIALATRNQKVTFFETGAVGHVHAPGAAGRTFFRLAPMGANLGRAGVDFVGERLYAGRHLRWAVAHVDDVYGSAVGEGAVAEVTRRGDTLAGVFSYDPRHFDPAALAAQVAASHPDALFVSAYLDDGIALRRAAVAAGTKLLAEIGTSSSYCHPAFGAALGRDAVGLFASDKPDAADVRADALSPGGRAALEWVKPRYASRYHEAMSAPALSGFSGAVGVLAHLLPVAKSWSPADVRAAAVKVRLPEGALPNGSGLALAPAGAVDAGDNRAATSVIWEWVAPAVRAVVWPPAFATSSIVR
jgi:ABC-type branched-subunit amino acid transport system substrate-binding protein